MKRGVFGPIVLAMLVLPILISSCTTGNGPDNSPATESPGTQTPSSEPSSTADAPVGEIWQWAIGMDMDDPALAEYMGFLFEDEMGGGAMVKSEGFELNLDSSATVRSVTLFNDESRLGFSENTFSAYKGELPAGLSWDNTATNVVELLGQPDESYTAGYGVELSFTYLDWEGYRLEISLAARHQQDLWDSPMHTIDVSWA